MADRSDLAARLARAAAVLRAGGLVAYPTETFYGLGALAARPEALARLATAKLRPEGKALPLLAGDLAQVEAVAVLDEALARRLAARLWPGPVTLLLPARPGLAPELLGADGTVAVRVPGLALARELALAAGGALVATSANLSGAPPPTEATALAPELVARIDLVLDGGPTPGGRPSTIVAVAGGAPRLVRPGAAAFEEVLAAAR